MTIRKILSILLALCFNFKSWRPWLIQTSGCDCQSVKTKIKFRSDQHMIKKICLLGMLREIFIYFYLSLVWLHRIWQISGIHKYNTDNTKYIYSNFTVLFITVSVDASLAHNKQTSENGPADHSSVYRKGQLFWKMQVSFHHNDKRGKCFACLNKIKGLIAQWGHSIELQKAKTITGK